VVKVRAFLIRTSRRVAIEHHHKEEKGKIVVRRVIFIKTFPSVVFVWAEQQAQTAKQLHHV
jgi:nucleoside diphosphate kinase